jgi:PPK2 family polyphosphate:nucleotide phosphotransferase
MKFNINSDDFRVKEGHKPGISNRDCKIEDVYADKDEYESFLDEYKKEICAMQDILYAHDKYSVLVIFQGMDACGKDGTIKHVMSGINPAGVQVMAFKRPSSEELDHDFLWRTTTRLPERGRIGIFNRSYYEEVLVVRVHPEILTEGQRIPGEFIKNPDKVWENRYEDIAAFEKYLHRNGTKVIKFFLHVSKKEQRKRLLERIDEPDKNWKMEINDLAERALWPQYEEAFEDAIHKTSTNDSPWFLIPADDKKNARLIVSSILLEEIKKLHLEYPELGAEQKEKLAAIREALMKEE